MDSPLLEKEPSHTLLTANRRQAARLQYDDDREQQAAGNRLWQTPDILPWEAWLRRLWDELLVCSTAQHPRLLNAQQERLLWEQVIQDSPLTPDLLQPTATAQRAQEAWRLLHAYQQTVPVADDWPNLDVRTFAAWAAAYHQRCETQNWLDAAGLPAYLTARIESGDLLLPESVTLRGFDELTPAQRALLDAAERCGCSVQISPDVPGESHAVCLACEDNEQELECAARWTRALLERGDVGRIGIVVHDLGALRAAVARHFDDVLDPAALLPGATRQPLYNISLGQPLSQYPIVAAALNLMNLGAELGALDVERLGGLLRSPFLGGGESEKISRARLDALVRESGEPTISINRLLFHVEEGGGNAPALAAALREWRSQRYEQPYKLGAAAWAEAFAASLRCVGWPRGRALDSAEYQTVEAWRDVVGQLAALDEVAGLIGYRQAVNKLRQLADETLFQPRTPELPVQILGLLEAEGLRFDHLWVVGWHDEVWPAAPHPHPLLPVSLQRRCQMPHSSAARELSFAEGVTERLLHAAPHIVVSWPGRDGDRTLRPSPLIQALPEVVVADLERSSETPYVRQVFASGKWESVDDALGEPYPEGGTARGGAAVFKEQAACPFRAYARFRLGAEPLGSPQPGLDAAARGSLMHRALECFWQVVPDQPTLLQLTPQAQQTQVADAVRQAIAEEIKRRPATFTERFVAIERVRLEQRLALWLEVERQRAPFQVVGAEKAREVEVGGLRVKARIDRIDRLEDGRLVIIDYKTGKSTVQAWWGERPDEPQLPLYALSSDSPLAALAFAELRPGACRFKGLADEPDLLPQVGRRANGLEAEWEWGDLLGEWSLVLADLAQAFRAGEARVDPKKRGETCRYCALTALCRVAEAEWIDGGDDE